MANGAETLVLRWPALLWEKVQPLSGRNYTLLLEISKFYKSNSVVFVGFEDNYEDLISLQSEFYRQNEDAGCV